MSGDGTAEHEWAVALVAGAEIGERPVWDDRTQTLVWVDIAAGQVRRYDPSTGTDSLVHQADDPVGCVALRENGGLLAAAGRRVVLLDADGRPESSITVPGADDTVFNDGAVDPWGRFVAGTSTLDTRPAGGALFSVSGDGEVRQLLDGITESNGVGWSPDGRTMYYVDSGETAFGQAHQTRIRTYAYDGRTGAIAAGPDLDVVPEADGIPDGLVVDQEGSVWVAMWGGHEVRRYRSDGQLTDRLPLPVSQPTCPGFAGDGLTDLYVTTAHQGLPTETRAAQPHAGNLFVTRAGVAGVAAGRFAG